MKNYNNKTNNDCIVIYTNKLARQLLRAGYTIVDVKANKADPDRKRSVFVFKIEDGLIETMHNINLTSLATLLSPQLLALIF